MPTPNLHHIEVAADKTQNITLELFHISSKNNFLQFLRFWCEINRKKMVVRSYEEECGYLERLTSHSWRIKKGFQPNMNVEGIFYVNDKLEKLMFDELKNACRPGKIN